MTTANESTSSWKEILTYFVGILALVGFTALTLWLLRRAATAADLEWTRAVYLFSGVEAIAFAATGFFFGKEVHRTEADRADKRANDANAKAIATNQRATEAETKGWVLSAAIKAKLKEQRAQVDALRTLDGGTAHRLMQADLEELESLADQLFP